jgi:hypothetical protein
MPKAHLARLISQTEVGIRQRTELLLILAALPGFLAKFCNRPGLLSLCPPRISGAACSSRGLLFHMYVSIPPAHPGTQGPRDVALVSYSRAGILLVCVVYLSRISRIRIDYRGSVYLACVLLVRDDRHVFGKVCPPGRICGKVVRSLLILPISHLAVLTR